MTRQANPRQNPEAGYILLAVLVLVALFLIALSVAAPRIAADIQRDKEIELIHRGQQYKRAIKLYYQKFGRYPSSIDQLENTNNIRFLRKRYTDPMTGKDDWKIVHFGEAHVKPLGLFSQPLAGAAGGSVLGGAATPGVNAPTSGSPFSSGGIGGGSSFGSNTNTSGATPATPSGSMYAAPPSTDSNSGTGDSSSGSSGTSSSSGPTGSTFGGSTSSSPGGLSSSGSSGTGGSFGGIMVGVASKKAKASILIYKLQKHYNEWEFVYDPVEDLMSSVSLLGGGGGNLNGPGTGLNSGTPTGPAPGPGLGSGGFGQQPGTPNGGFGGTPPTPAPQQPQQ